MRSRGITLLELLTVLVIVGIIAALALPSFLRQLRRVHRTEATVALHALLAAQERFHLLHGRYTADLGAAPPAGLGIATLTEGRRYELVVALSADAQTFIATATPTREGGQAADLECLAFSVDQSGRRAVSGTGESGHCWR